MTFNDADHPRGHATNPGSCSEKTQGKPETALAASRPDAETLLSEARATLAEAQSTCEDAARTFVAELILTEMPTAVSAKIELETDDGDDAYPYLSQVVDAEGEELWGFGYEDDIRERLAWANDLLEEFGLSGQLDLTPYRETPDSIIVLKIKLAGDDERERLVDDATDDERLEPAVHPNADIRFLVARSPETDVDTLSILREDSDENVAAAAEHSIGS